MIKKLPETKWLVLILAGLTNAIAGAAPSMSMSVLFHEVSGDLNLSLVQVGLIWGLGSVPAIVSMLLGGVIVDRFGPKRIAIIGAILVGIMGALRGLANGFYPLLFATILLGFFTPLVIASNLKTSRLWFSGKNFGLANGILSMGMALGFMLSSLLSASVLSPWLGGWRNVFFLYGALALLITLPWLLTPSAAAASADSKTEPEKTTFLQSISQLVKLPNLWLLGIAILGIGGSIQGTLGYIPLYLRNIGWEGIQADGALSLFHTMSLLCVIPITMLSDRLKHRKSALVAMAAMIMIGIGLLAVVNGGWVWAAVVIAGFVRDGFMAIFMAIIVETQGVSAKASGTAIGLVMIFSGLGNLTAPPLGNNMAAFNPSAPFALWAGFAAVGFIALLLLKEERKTKPVTA